jgi:ABC-type glycerol-3-phosphate transport system substrate-binding protein
MAVAHQYESLFLIEEVALAFADPSLIEEGKVAMWPSHYSSYFSKSVNGNWGAVPYPSTSVIGTNGLVMSSGSRNPDAAWKWMSFLSKQGQLVSNSTLPARASVAETNQFWQNAAPEITETMHYALENSRVFRPNPGYEILDDAMNTILRGEKTVEASFSQAQLLAEQLVASTDASDEEIFPIVVDNTAEGNNSDVTSVTFWLLNDENIQSYRTLADEFEVNARVHINFRFFNSNEEYPNLTTIAQSSDCFRWISLRDNTYQNSVLNLDPLIATDPSVDIIDFFPLAVDQFTAEGQLWGLPADLNPIIIEYNKALFDAASIPYPSFEWTVDDFLSTAIELTKGEGQTKQYGFVSDIAELVLLKTMMVQLGAELIDSSKNPPTTTFTEQTTIEAMRWYTSLSAEYNVKPLFQIDIIGNRTADYEEYMRLLRRGQAAMWTAYTFPIPTEAKETTNIGAVPLPSGIGNAGIENPGMGYFISASASPQNRQACWEWIKLLTESVDVVRGVPARRSVAESATYAQRVGQAQAAAYLASFSQVKTSSLSNSDSAFWWMFPYELWLGHSHDQIAFNGIPVEEAMAAAQQTFDAYRACVIEKNAFDDRKLQEQCLVEVDPTLAELFNAGGE